MDADEARAQVEQAIDRLTKAAAADVAGGADPAEIARQLAEVTADWSPEEKME